MTVSSMPKPHLVGQALLALSTSHEAWRELIRSYNLSWDHAETWLTEALARALLKPSPETLDRYLLRRGC